MKKKAIALAVGAMCAAPAAHSQIMFGNDTIGTVQFYGKLYPQFNTSTSKGATQAGETVSTLVAAPTTATAVDPGRRNSIDSANSYLGFRGERALGRTGLKGIWQVEQTVALETGTGTFSSRNSFAGVSHGTWGTVKLGNMDTIYKEYGDTLGLLGTSSGNFTSASNVLSHIGTGNNRLARFHERRPNAISYETGKFAGVQAGIMYGPDEARGNAGTRTNASLYSYGVKWDGGPVYVSLHQERHNDFFGGSANSAGALSNIGTAGAHSTDVATRLSAEWRVAGHRITGDIARLDYKETGQTAGATRFSTYKKVNWALGWEGKWSDAWRTAVQLVVGGAGTCTITVGDCSTTGLRGTMLNAGVGYSFDRQTMLYLIASRLTNGTSALYDNWDLTDPARGGDVTQMAVGFSYSF